MSSDTQRNNASGGWLWVSAGVLAALIVVQGAGLVDSPAHAEMTSSSGAYTMMTTDGGNDEILVVVDSSQESMMVYRSDRNQGLQLLEREDLAGLFSRARARAFGRP
ncbi:MAG: hypothetical protein ACX94C_13390 [Phycisphaerales bacterium]